MQTTMSVLAYMQVQKSPMQSQQLCEASFQGVSPQSTDEVGYPLKMPRKWCQADIPVPMLHIKSTAIMVRQNLLSSHVCVRIAILR